MEGKIVPKVSEAYFENKKKQILDAAFSICMKKPVSDVIMSDIVAESGLSQGGVYKYYANIDDIFIGLANRINANYSFQKEFDKIIVSENTPESIIREIFDFVGKHLSETLTGYGKISFELDTMFANYPEREIYYRSKVYNSSDFDYLIKHTFDYIEQKVEEGYFKPILPVHDIFMFIIASFDGIRRDVILSKCYQSKDTIPSGFEFDEQKLIRSLCTSCLLLLTGKTNTMEGV